MGNKFQLDFDQNTPIFIQENTFENVICEVSSIFVSASMCEPAQLQSQCMTTVPWMARVGFQDIDCGQNIFFELFVSCI